jgi:hypothetical protein
MWLYSVTSRLVRACSQRPNPRNRQRNTLVFESLEPRLLLAADLALVVMAANAPECLLSVKADVAPSNYGTRVSAMSCFEVSSTQTSGCRDHGAAYTRRARLPSQLRRRCWLRRDDPALSAMRLESGFLSVRPIVESLPRDAEFHDLVLQQPKIQRARPLGG